jgi:hypothetical protein
MTLRCVPVFEHRKRVLGHRTGSQSDKALKFGIVSQRTEVVVKVPDNAPHLAKLNKLSDVPQRCVAVS